MNDNTLVKALNKLLTNDAINKIRDKIIIQNNDGSYELFNRYKIDKKDENFVVYKIYGDQLLEFSSLKIAVTYIIFDKNNKISDCKRVEFLDKKIVGLDLDIENSLRLAKRLKDEGRITQIIKLQDNRFKKKKYQKELEFYISNAHYWQLRQFEASTY